MADEDSVLYSLVDGVARITLNRPERKNAIDEPMWRSLAEVLAAVRVDPEVRVVVLSGAGGEFCAGADVAKSKHNEHPVPRLRRIGDVALALYELPMPVVASVDGVAAGAGCNMALACDLVIASARSRFTEIFTRRGLSIDFGGSWLLPRVVGMQQAKRLAYLADVIDAEEAFRLGMVTWLTSQEEHQDFVSATAERIAKLPPIALAQTKRLLNEGAANSLREAVANEAAAQAVNLATDDARAAFKAFLEKTDAPVYSGRWSVG
jgi:enoyl-CoA hydratase/carnithine racemase